MALSPITFYSTNAKRKCYNSAIERRIEEHLAKRFEGKRVISSLTQHPHKSSFLRPLENIWERFTKQIDAYEFLDAKIAEDDNAKSLLRMFAYEQDRNGKRYYVVCTLDRFCSHYKHMTERHWYEVILQNSPVRMYFDIEFYEKYNPNLVGETCMRNFKNFFTEICSEKLNLSIEDSDILELCGSRPGKFSRHLIIHFRDKKVLHSNQSAGRLVGDMITTINGDPAKYQNLGLLVCKNEENSLVPLFDPAVYSKNRNFRLVLSSKVGSSEYPLKLKEPSPFYKSNSCTVLKAFEGRLVKDSLITVLDSKIDDILPFYLPCSPIGALNSVQSHSSVGKHIPKSNLPSFFPHIDSFILDEIIIPRNSGGFIRSWRVFSNKDWTNVENIDDLQDQNDVIIIYEIGGARFCLNIEREHKSNHVKWLVNLKKNIYYQKCNDPECRQQSFCSNEFPLPERISSARIEQSLSIEDLTDSDSELLQFIDEENL